VAGTKYYIHTCNVTLSHMKDKNDCIKTMEFHKSQKRLGVKTFIYNRHVLLASHCSLCS